MVDARHERRDLLVRAFRVLQRLRIYGDEEAVHKRSCRNERAVLSSEIDGAAIEELLARAHVLVLAHERVRLAVHNLYEIEAQNEEQRDEHDTAGENSEPEAERATHMLPAYYFAKERPESSAAAT